MHNSILHTHDVLLALRRCILKPFRPILCFTLASVYMVMVCVCTVFIDKSDMLLFSCTLSEINCVWSSNDHINRLPTFAKYSHSWKVSPHMGNRKARTMTIYSEAKINRKLAPTFFSMHLTRANNTSCVCRIQYCIQMMCY